MPTAGLVVSCEPIKDLALLEKEWRDLERRSDPSVFLSWQWLGQWLRVYKPNARVLKAWDQDRIVGMGLVVETEELRHGVLRSHCLRLHQTGDRLLDQIWIEYNGFLTESGYHYPVLEACLNFLCAKMPEWDEFIVGAIDADEAAQYAEITGLHPHIRWEAPCYGVDLEILRHSPESYLSTLSRNTRYQIRRSHRLYESLGEVRLERPDSTADALELFDSIGPFHLDRWGSGPDESGYANPNFVRFHHSMIQEQWPKGGVDLVKLSTGSETIAAFYNLIHEGVVYFYLGGMRPEADNRLHPGLLGHSLCIEDYREKGFSYYDFMGGNERYKSNLGQSHRHLVQVSLQRDRLKLKLEEVARRAKNRWLAASKVDGSK